MQYSWNWLVSDRLCISEFTRGQWKLLVSAWRNTSELYRFVTTWRPQRCRLLSSLPASSPLLCRILSLRILQLLCHSLHLHQCLYTSTQNHNLLSKFQLESLTCRLPLHIFPAPVWGFAPGCRQLKQNLFQTVLGARDQTPLPGWLKTSWREWRGTFQTEWDPPQPPKSLTSWSQHVTQPASRYCQPLIPSELLARASQARHLCFRAVQCYSLRPPHMTPFTLGPWAPETKTWKGRDESCRRSRDGCRSRGRRWCCSRDNKKRRGRDERCRRSRDGCRSRGRRWCCSRDNKKRRGRRWRWLI